MFTENLYYYYSIILNPLSFYVSTFQICRYLKGAGRAGLSFVRQMKNTDGI